MKFAISSKELQSKLIVVSKVMSKKNIVRIMDYALVQRNGDGFSLTGASTENQISVDFDLHMLSSDDFVPFCIDVNQFLTITATLNEQPLEIVVEPEKNFCTTIGYLGGDFQLASMPATDFHLQPRIENVSVAFDVPVNVLMPCLKAASSCVTQDELRPVMASVAMDVAQDGITFVGTNGHSLYRYAYTHGLPFLTDGQPSLLMIPFNMANAITAAVDNANVVSMRFDGKKVEIISDDVVLIARCIEGRYPNYNAVIPSDSPYHVVFSVRDFTMALKRASIMANSASNLISISKEAGKLMLRSADVDFERSFKEEIPCDDCTLPDNFKIGLKASNLILLLGNIATNNVRIGLSICDKPVLLKEDDDNSPLTELLMPMNIE